MWYEVAARIPGAGYDENVAVCFDPEIVIHRLQKAFTDEVTVCIHDYAWKDFDTFTEMRASRAAIRLAESDARRRGPIFIFRFRTDTRQKIYGKAERYFVSISSQQPIPESIKSRFIEFLNQLEHKPIQVRSVRIDGNTIHDA